MSKLNLFVIILLAVLLFSQNVMAQSEKETFYLEYINGNKYQKVIDVNADKEIIYKKVIEFVVSQFTDQDSQIKVKDDAELTIKGVGNSIMKMENLAGSGTYNCFFDYTFEVKDNKFRVTIETPYVKLVVPVTGTIAIQYIHGFLSLEERKAARYFCDAFYNKKILQDLKDFIEDKVKKDTNW